MIGEATCLSAVKVGAGEKMTAANLDPGKLTLTANQMQAQSATTRSGERLKEIIGHQNFVRGWVQYL